MNTEDTKNETLAKMKDAIKALSRDVENDATLDTAHKLATAIASALSAAKMMRVAKAREELAVHHLAMALNASNAPQVAEYDAPPGATKYAKAKRFK
jgi:Xaa-Pro aminopeptidase